MPEGEDPEQPRRPAPPVHTVRAGIVVGAFIVALLLLLGPASHLTATPPPTTHAAGPPPAPVVKSKTVVQVVNGTLASGAGRTYQQELGRLGWDALTAEGLKGVRVTTANQQPSSWVYFLPHHQAAAQLVAAELGIKHVMLRSRSVLNEVQGAYRDTVVVLLGTDLVH